MLTDKSAEIIVYGVGMDCSALGEEAAARVGVVYLDGKEVWMGAGLLVECKRTPRSACMRWGISLEQYRGMHQDMGKRG